VCTISAHGDPLGSWVGSVAWLNKQVQPESSFILMSDELIRIALTWPVSTIDGEPSLTSGMLVVLREPGGDFLLSVSAGDENFPDCDEIQFPLSAEHARLVQRALAGEQLGDIED